MTNYVDRKAMWYILKRKSNQKCMNPDSKFPICKIGNTEH